MEKYDYRTAMKEDIEWSLFFWHDIDELIEFKTFDEAYEFLWEKYWGEDTITGNGENFYNTEEQCSYYLAGNFDLLYEAIEELCPDISAIELIKHYENKTIARYFDCTIRCYLLSECIDELLRRFIGSGILKNIKY